MRPTVLDMNGDVFQEDAMRHVVDPSHMFLGNWTREPFDELLGRHLNKTLDLTNPARECMACKYFSRCRSGDLNYRFSAATGTFGPSVICEALKDDFARADALLAPALAKKKRLAA